MAPLTPGQRVKVVRLPKSYYQMANAYDRRPSVLRLSGRGLIRNRIQAYRNSRGREHSIVAIEKKGRHTYIVLTVNGQNLEFTPCCLRVTDPKPNNGV
jgi:hypothetical protein